MHSCVTIPPYKYAFCFFCETHMSTRTREEWEIVRRQEWLRMLKAQWIDMQFAEQAREAFGGFPSLELLKVLWDTPWGETVKEHFGMDELQVSELHRAILAQLLNDDEEIHTSTLKF